MAKWKLTFSQGSNWFVDYVKNLVLISQNRNMSNPHVIHSVYLLVPHRNRDAGWKLQHVDMAIKYCFNRPEMKLLLEKGVIIAYQKSGSKNIIDRLISSMPAERQSLGAFKKELERFLVFMSPVTEATWIDRF